MKVTKCDRCMREIHSYESYKYFFQEKKTRIYEVETYKTYELCNECARELNKFLRGKK